MHSMTIAVVAALALPSTFAMPNSQTRRDAPYPQPVTVFTSDVKSVSQLPHAPSSLSSRTTDFLKKFQPYSEKASSAIGPKGSTDIVSNGWCFAQYPCMTVTRPATVEIRATDGSILPTITEDNMASLLDSILVTPVTTFKASIFNGINQLQLQKAGVALNVFGLDKTLSSDVLAGVVFDIYKIHADVTTTNSVRAVQVDTKVALCLSPVGADPLAVQNFCFGKQLDGSLPIPGNQKREVTEKRGSLGIGCAFAAVIPIIGWLAAGFCSTF